MSNKRSFDGVVNPSVFNEEYYKSHRDRAPAGVQAYLRVGDDEHMQGIMQMARTLKKLYPYIRKVLILGCGRGEYVKAFKDIGVKALGVDYSDYAYSNLVTGLSKSDVVKANICELSFARDNEFDLVLALDIFNCIRVPALYNALAEASRVGKLLIVDLPVNPDDSSPDMCSIYNNHDVSIYSQEWWLGHFNELGLEYYKGQEYTYPEKQEGARWSDGLIHNYTMYFRKPFTRPTAKTVPKIKISEPDTAKDMRLVWWANSPFCPTGYGTGTEQVVFKAAEYYNLAVLCNYGLEGRAIRMGAQDGRYKTNTIMFPKLFEPSGGDAASLVVQNWKPEVIVTLFDIWVGEGNNAYTSRPPNWMRAMFKDQYWIAQVPVDHDPIPYPVLNQCAQVDRVVAMSKFGQDQLAQRDVGSELIPHGVYTDTFTPVKDKEVAVKNLIDRGSPMDLDTTVDWGMDDFIVGVNAANKDTARKGYEQIFRAFSHFLANNPDAKKDAKLYLHTWQDFPGGLPLYPLAKCFDVDPYVRVTHKWYMYNGLSTERMAEIYQGFDVFMNISRNEGFGIPIIEAASCGVPSIVTDFTSMPELVKGHGWLVKPVTHVTDLLMSNTAIPNYYEAAEYLEDAYNNPDKVKKMGEKARRFAVNHFDVESVIQPLWMDLFEDVRMELKKRKPVESKGEWIE